MFKKTVLPLTILAVALAGFALAYRAVESFQAYLFHADALYLPAVFADLFARGGRLSDWFLTPAPYFFPDFALYLVAYPLGGNLFGEIFVFAVAQILMTTVALSFIVRATAERYHLATTSLIMAGLIWLSMNAGEPYVELISSAYHFGAFLSALAFVACWLHLQRHDSKPARQLMTVAMCVLAFLTTLSDNIFLVQAVIPFLAVCCLIPDATGTSRRSRAIVPVAVLLASILGSLSYKLFVTHSTRYPTKLGWAQVGEHAHDLIGIFGTQFKTAPLVALVILVYLCLGAACCVARARKRTLFGMPNTLITLVIFSVISVATTIAAVLFVKNLPPSPRYVIPVFIWPLIVVTLVAQHLAGRKFFWVTTYAGVLLALSVLAPALRLPQAADAGIYPEEIACIDKALAGKSLRNGIAQYWDAKHIQMLSHQQITLAQYYSDLAPQKWITSERYFRNAYDFAIIAEDAAPPFKLPVDVLTAINGAPAENISCGNRRVLIYGQGKLHLPKTAPAT